MILEDLPRFKDCIWWIQDAASQIPCTILLSKIKKNFLKPIQSLKIIDMCCAPGGKTAQLLDNNLDHTLVLLLLAKLIYKNYKEKSKVLAIDL